jgi:putative transposase/transposase-like zinc-binding protein
MLVAPQYEEFAYNRRVPEQELLHQVLVEHLETFLDRARIEEHTLPLYVEKELRDYVDCGILGRGFVRIECEDCGKEKALAFSCMGRGFCPSCTGRRMADTAARLVDDVFPNDVPVRQWVLSLPIEIRYRLAYDGRLLSDVLAVFLRVVRGWYYKQAKAAGYKDVRCGSVTFAQRFGSSLNLNPHFHVLQIDGVYVQAEDAPVFVPAPELTDEDVHQIVETTAKRVIRLLERRGILGGDDLDPLVDESPVLAGMTAASVQGLVATGERAGMRVRRVLSDPTEAIRTGDLCYASSGFSLHAATRIDAENKDGLERLCRYVARPPLAAGSLTRISDDLLSFKLKTPWSDGTTSILLSPMELIEKISALVPPPRVNLVRYHGVLAPHAKNREKIVPADRTAEDADTADDENTASRRYRLTWAALLARVFKISADVCSHCGGKMKIVAAVTDPASVRHYLKGTGQSAGIPILAPARAPPQEEWDF